MRLAVYVFFISGTLSLWAAEKVTLTITVVSRESSCAANVDCNTTTFGGGQQTVTTHQLHVENIIEANGERFIIQCTASGAASNCAPMKDGDRFQAEYDGKSTMWVSARKGENLGKPVSIKYKVLDRRPAGANGTTLSETVSGTLGAVKISEAQAGAEFDERIAAEFPEIAEDSKRISEGEPPQSELFKRAAEIYGQAIADDPSLKDSESVALMAARQAKAEIAAKKGKDVPEAGALRVR